MKNYARFSSEKTSSDEKEEEMAEFQFMPDVGNWLPGQPVHFGPASRVICTPTVMDDEACTGMISQLYELDSTEDPVIVMINTYGGSLVGALGVYDTLRTISAPIITMVIGNCFSAGLLVLCAGDQRLASPHSMLFYHQPVMDREDALYSHMDAKAQLEYYEWSMKTADELLKQRMKIEPRVWRREFAGKTSKYITIEDAIRLNLIDHVLDYANKATISLEKVS